jgi:hypothetical protein
LYGLLALSLLGMIFMIGAQRSLVAWLACAVVIGLLVWRWWQQRRFESVFWEQKRKLSVWFEEGQLRASAEDVDLQESESLSDINAIDALEENGSVVRLLVDKEDGTRTIYAGFDDMDAFAREFRLNAPRPSFVAFGWHSQ